MSQKTTFPFSWERRNYFYPRMKQKSQNKNLHINKLIVLERKTIFYLQNNNDAAFLSKLIFFHDVSKCIIL